MLADGQKFTAPLSYAPLPQEVVAKESSCYFADRRMSAQATPLAGTRTWSWIAAICGACGREMRSRTLVTFLFAASVFLMTALLVCRVVGTLLACRGASSV